MATARWGVGVMTAGLFIWSCTLPASAQTGDKFSPTYKSRQEDVDGVLRYRPRMEGVDYSKPTPEEQKSCTMKLILGEQPNSTGWLLLDPQGRPLRRFMDTTGKKRADGRNHTDVWSYYKDGVEVYREIDTDMNDKPDQYRWFNAGGSKWGIDANEDGKIEAWRQISAEETAQEAFAAVATRDLNRLKALLITDAEAASLKLPEAQLAKIRDNLARAQTRFTELVPKLPLLTPQATLKSVETAVPQCVPANANLGPAQDILTHANRALLYESADKKQHEWLNTGEMILVGQAWRLTEVPSLTENSAPPAATQSDEALKKLMDDLMALDKNPPPSPPGVGKYPAVVDYNVKRVALLEQIHAKMTDPKEKETWMRQILDNLCTAQQANLGDSTLQNRLIDYKNKLAKSAPGSSLAGYAHYREMWARFAADLAGVGPTKDLAKVQHDWQDELVRFVRDYAKAEDAPDALWQLAMSAEYGGKDKQDEAKKYYGLIVSNFPEHPLAPKARGAARRMDLVGQPMELAAPTVQGSAFDIAKLAQQKKVVLVYYWASSCKVCIGDFAVMKQLHTTYAAKGFEIVTVNLDEQLATAQQYLTAAAVPGTHLFQATEQNRGMESPLALQYGIVGLPTMILVGKDGRVADRSLQINDLEDALKKALER